MAIGLAGVISLAACADSAGETGSTLDLGTTMPGGTGTTMEGATGGIDAEAAAAELQDEMSALAEEIQNSQAAGELEQMWTELQPELSGALAEFQAEGTLNTSGIENQLAEFEDDLEGLGDQIEPELLEAWESFRAQLNLLAN